MVSRTVNKLFTGCVSLESIKFGIFFFGDIFSDIKSGLFLLKYSRLCFVSFKSLLLSILISYLTLGFFPTEETVVAVEAADNVVVLKFGCKL